MELSSLLECSTICESRLTLLILTAAASGLATSETFVLKDRGGNDDDDVGRIDAAAVIAVASAATAEETSCYGRPSSAE